MNHPLLIFLSVTIIYLFYATAQHSVAQKRFMLPDFAAYH